MEIYSDIAYNEINACVLLARHAIIDGEYSNNNPFPATRIYVVKEGRGTLYCKDQAIPFVGGNIYILPNNVEYSLETAYFEKLFFHLTVPTPDTQDIFAQLDRVYTLPCPENEYEILYQLVMSKSYYDKLKLKMHLLSILIQLQETYPLPEANIKQYSKIVIHALRFIQTYASSNLRTADIAQYCRVSESRIRNAFRKEIGVPIGKYKDEVLISKATELLTCSNMTISEISEHLGFCDQFYFSQAFKKWFGINPSQFRKQNKIYMP